MSRILKLFLAALVALFATVFAAQAQAPERAPQRPFSQAELDQMLAPIALYPDSLLSQILIAASYPNDVFEAAAWSRSHRELRGVNAVRAAGNERWDASVVGLTAFPDVLQLLDERRYWTQKLGEAFVEQPVQVMETVQGLRRRADGAGTLRTSEEIVVERRGPDYVIEPASPEVVYVPYYDPRYAYGPWWWADYPPVYWRPWRGYAYYPGYTGLAWGYGVTTGPSFFFGAFDWPRRYVYYSHYRPWYYRGPTYSGGHRWSYTQNPRWRDGRNEGRWRDGPRDGTRDGTRDGRWRNSEPRWRDGTRTAPPPPRTEQRAEAPPVQRVVPQGERAPVIRQHVAPAPAPAPAPRAERDRETSRNPAERRAPVNER